MEIVLSTYVAQQERGKKGIIYQQHSKREGDELPVVDSLERLCVGRKSGLPHFASVRGDRADEGRDGMGWGRGEDRERGRIKENSEFTKIFDWAISLGAVIFDWVIWLCSPSNNKM